MTQPARDRLAAEQAALLRALLAGGPPPPGFDVGRLRIESAALLAKRRRVVQRLRPDLADRLGSRFAEVFGAWAIANPQRDGTGGPADAETFAAWLGTGAGPRAVPGAEPGAVPGAEPPATGGRRRGRGRGRGGR